MLRTSNTMILDASTEIAISAAAAMMNLTRLEIIRLAIREWLTARENARFPTEGHASHQSLAPERSDVPD
ncbi:MULTISPECIES: hypothetical protein [unclassified Mesorhizobium]|uniref:hypothetical protein n=1 Tax=unclassified Mesorhizobium TaxID=325217 RepID=UPI00112790BD|nr:MULTISPECIES: hypothetical protein [unclassified Mesorhizobium]TPI57431.1 hypothetical protein FJ417_21900 [Mesorhizobium sp. B3-1-7]TPJ37111.1 hypothetical protein FJ418_02320 [Mesorhizobium sp. B2-8-3]